LRAARCKRAGSRRALPRSAIPIQIRLLDRDLDARVARACDCAALCARTRCGRLRSGRWRKPIRWLRVNLPLRLRSARGGKRQRGLPFGLAQRTAASFEGCKSRVDFAMPIVIDGQVAVGGRNFGGGSPRGRRRGHARRHGSLRNRAQAKFAEAAGRRLLFTEGTTLRTCSYQSSFCAAGALRDACILSAIVALPSADARRVANRTTHLDMNNPLQIGGIFSGDRGNIAE
jgi:hypothetical protein